MLRMKEMRPANPCNERWFCYHFLVGNPGAPHAGTPFKLAHKWNVARLRCGAKGAMRLAVSLTSGR